MMVALAVGVTKPRVVVLPPDVALTTLESLPWRVNDWPVAPIVNAPEGVMVLSAVVEVISLFAPLAAAPKLLLAPPALLEPVPPLATGSWPVKVISPVADNAILPEAETAKVPLAFGNVIARLPVKVAGWMVAPNALDPSRKTNTPKVVPVPIVKPPEPWIISSPPIVMTEPDSVIIESPIVVAPVNLARAPLVPEPLILPPDAQLPLVVQNS